MKTAQLVLESVNFIVGLLDNSYFLATLVVQGLCITHICYARAYLSVHQCPRCAAGVVRGWRGRLGQSGSSRKQRAPAADPTKLRPTRRFSPPEPRTLLPSSLDAGTLTSLSTVCLTQKSIHHARRGMSACIGPWIAMHARPTHDTPDPAPPHFAATKPYYYMLHVL